jgi:hypothetical protein
MAVEDRIADNRSVALQALVDIDPETARPLVGRLRSRLARATDYATVLDAARTLTFLRDLDSLPAMPLRAEKWSPGIFYRRKLEAYALALEGRQDAILDAIRAHDHVAMP